MQLLEAVALSSISTLIIVGICLLRIIRGERKISSNFIQSEDIEMLKERILREVRIARSPMLRKTTVALFPQ